ncbi:IucA/IucC family protein [Tateyamaria omphalii]|uniref:IucA/IucC family protein n=1 Tax=Tateyamaria omphalii TaxID=299262 RepID=UPI0021BDB214|nr:IucA/IucC family protein [Tateyamaria omphalii]
MAMEFALPESCARLRAEVTYWSLVGPHDFGTVTIFDQTVKMWRPAHPAQVITMLLMECEARISGADSNGMLELMRRVLNSYDQISKLGQNARGPSASFLSAEQGLHFGHWLHPTPKSREGMTDWQQAVYAPEFRNSFQLHYFAADNTLVEAGSADAQSTHALLADIPGLALDDIGPDETVIPLHPLQAQAMLLRPEVQALIAAGHLRNLGLRGGKFAATSSVRTVYASDYRWMLKFSLPVKITNSHRVNLHHELEAGVVMARLLKKIGPLSPRFQIINDPAFVTLSLPDCSESGFEVIFRENPFMGQAGDGVVTIAALTADPLPGQHSLLSRSVMDLSRRENSLPSKIALRWFKAYLDCAVRPALDLYERWGIALEAHQQNSLLDIGSGLPTRAFFRDNQGYYVADTLLDTLSGLEPSLRNIKALCFAEAEINERYCYYLIVNQVFSIISRLGRDGLADESALVTRFRAFLQEVGTLAKGPAAGFVKFVLNADHLPAKGNLLTRLHDVDELQADGEKAVYVRLANPLAMSAAEDCHVRA